MKRISHFRFSRSQRSGIFFFTLVVMVLQGLIWKGVFVSEATPGELSDAYIAEVNRLMDSLKRAESAVLNTPKPFNPNYMSDHMGYRFGMTPGQIDRLFAYREAGHFVNSAKDFQKVTGVHDSVYGVMAPLFVFPRFARTVNPVVDKVTRADLNTAGVKALQEVYGIGPVLAERIIAYREQIGGFALPDQLTEVYGLSADVQKEIWRHFHLDQPAVYPRLDINLAGLNELAAIPYISKALAAKIVAYRSVHQQLDSLEELTKFHNLSKKDLTRIELYLRVK